MNIIKQLWRLASDAVFVRGVYFVAQCKALAAKWSVK